MAVDEVISSWNADWSAECKMCGKWATLALHCWDCGSWTCARCMGVEPARVSITRLCRCNSCTLALLRDCARPDGLTQNFEEEAVPLIAGMQSLRQHGGTYMYRHSSIRNLLRFSETFGLETLPGTPSVYEAFVSHRLLVQGVNVATIEHDIITASTWHSDCRTKLGVDFQDPAKHISVKQFVKRLSTSVRVQANPTVPFSFREFVQMIKSLGDSPRHWHARVALQVLTFPALRKRAAMKLYIRRRPPHQLHSLDFVRKGEGASDVFIYPHHKFKKVVALRKNVDKALQAGREQWSWLCDNLKCGLTPASDVEYYITTFPLPDGPLLAAPTGPRATSFRKTEYTALDSMVQTSYSSAFPEKAGAKVQPHGCRKTLIQALYDMLKLLGKFSDGDIGEYVGWVSVKNATRPYYAGLEQDDYLEMVASLDPEALPWHIATVNIGPFART